MANYQQMRSDQFKDMGQNVKYIFDDNKDSIEIGLPMFTVDENGGRLHHVFMIIKNGPRADLLRKFFNEKKEKIHLRDGTLLDLGAEILDCYSNLDKPGYEDVTRGKEPNLNIKKYS